MNRIHYLIQQAKTNEPFECSYTKQQWLERFAGLIIEECLEIVEDEDDGSVDTRPVRWAMHRIKKHFGVEQIRKCDVCDCMYPCSTSRNEKPWD